MSRLSAGTEEERGARSENRGDSYSEVVFLPTRYSLLSPGPMVHLPKWLRLNRNLEPEYKNLSDSMLADKIYADYFSDLPRAVFDRLIVSQPG